MSSQNRCFTITFHVCFETEYINVPHSQFFYIASHKLWTMILNRWILNSKKPFGLIHKINGWNKNCSLLYTCKFVDKLFGVNSTSVVNEPYRWRRPSRRTLKLLTYGCLQFCFIYFLCIKKVNKNFFNL